MSATTPELDVAEVERLADIVLDLQHCLILRLSEQLAQGTVPLSQFFLLSLIASEPLSMTTIARRMNHSTAAATGTVNRLTKLGYVQRTALENDRRKVLVKITKKGSELVESIRQDIIKSLLQIMAWLPLRDQAAWLRIYEKIEAYCQNKQCHQ